MQKGKNEADNRQHQKHEQQRPPDFRAHSRHSLGSNRIRHDGNDKKENRDLDKSHDLAPFSITHRNARAEPFYR